MRAPPLPPHAGVLETPAIAELGQNYL